MSSQDFLYGKKVIYNQIRLQILDSCPEGVSNRFSCGIGQLLNNFRPWPNGKALLSGGKDWEFESPWYRIFVFLLGRSSFL